MTIRITQSTVTVFGYVDEHGQPPVETVDAVLTDLMQQLLLPPPSDDADASETVEETADA